MNSIVWIGVLFGVVAAVLMTILMLLQARGCDAPLSNAYEPFTSGAALIKDRISRIQNAKGIIQDDIDRLGEIEDETCAIMSQIQEVFIKNSSAALLNEEEYDLPADTQAKFADQRKRRAKIRWEENKKLYSGLRKNVRLLECFTSSDTTDAQETLATEVAELETIIQSPIVRGILRRVESTRASLGFNEEQLNKGLGPAIVETSIVNEGFVSQLRGVPLLIKADELLGKALAFHTAINELQNEVQTQSNTTKNVLSTSSDILSGNIIPT